MIYHLPVALTVLSLVTAAFAGPTNYGGPKCGSHLSAEDIDANESKFADSLSRIGGVTRLTDNFSNHTISVYFNVIYSGKKLEQGYIPDQQIKDQIKVLNDDYRDTGLKFKLAKTNRIKSAQWFENANADTPEEKAMKEKHRRGGPADLNVFTVSLDNLEEEGLLGYATFPAQYYEDPKKDGIVLRYSTLPGGTSAPANLGRTLTHEVGHWVGLYHTFENGCDGVGDYVFDTPAEAEAAQGCPEKRDTCGGSEGFDPIHNFMDYSDDSCMDHFTKGQVARLRSQISIFRNIPL